MNKFLQTRSLLFIVVLSLVTQACGALTSSTPLAPVKTTEIPADTQAPVETTPAPINTTTPNPEDVCPTPGEGTSLYVSNENGFCLLYPTSFTAKPDEQRPDQVITLLGPRETDKPKTQEEITVSLSVAYNGPADGLDSAAYASKWYTYFVGGSNIPYDGQQISLAGQPAVMLKDLPGFVAQRSAFVVANGNKYQITLSPQPEDMPELAEAASLGWDTVTKSIVFFPPQSQRQVKRPEQVCPKESAEMRPYRDDVNGYCFLYPADYAPDPQFPGMIKGGPVLGQWEGGDIRTYVAAGTFGYLPGQTPRQVLEPRMDVIDAGSVQDATIGGYPAVIFRSFQGPWPSRQAIIVVDGNVYTLVGEPWDPEKYPDGIPYLDKLWEAVTGSMTFFDPWR
jgi:hypothetical protein